MGNTLTTALLHDHNWTVPFGLIVLNFETQSNKSGFFWYSKASESSKTKEVKKKI